MVEVRIECSRECSWVCRGCGEHLFADRLQDLGYEDHDTCYQQLHGRHMPGIARAAGCSDIYSFMATETYMVGHVDHVVLSQH